MKKDEPLKIKGTLDGVLKVAVRPKKTTKKVVNNRPNKKVKK